MLHFFTRMSLLTAVVLAALVVLSLFFRNFWCRYACPYGALMGVFALFSPSRIQRNPDSCINCDQCSKVCPSHLPVNRVNQVLSPECTGCMDCVNVCPSKNTLELKVFSKPIKTAHIGILIMAIFFGMVYCATITGHWKSQLSEAEFRMWLIRADTSEIQHPSVQFYEENNDE